MLCLDCENCKQGIATYFCLAKNNFVIDEKLEELEKNKIRSGWKKGNKNYERHRRSNRKEVE